MPRYVSGRYGHRRTPGVRARFRLGKQSRNGALRDRQRDDKRGVEWCGRRIPVLGRGAAAIRFTLSDDPSGSVLGPVHRTRVVRAARHACFGGRHPAGADASLTGDECQGQEHGREPPAEAQHPTRMREPRCGVKSRRLTPSISPSRHERGDRNADRCAEDPDGDPRVDTRPSQIVRAPRGSTT